jgi:hypothetical protein
MKTQKYSNAHVTPDNKGVIGDSNEVATVISGDGYKGNIGNSGGTNVNISTPNSGKLKIIKTFSVR